MHVLVFGAGGQLGRELDVATSGRSVAATLLPRKRADICDRHAVVAAVQRVNPTVIVNAAAYTKVDQAEVEPERAFSGNCEGPALLADVCADRGLPLVHISTDYVFDGAKPTPYRETDPVTPMSAYGRSKAAGEQAIRARLKHHVILRTAWVYGVHGSNFLKTMLSLARQKESWSVVADQCGNPTATVDLAEAILAIATRASEGAAPWGTYHFAGAGDATWHDFACEIMAAQAPFTNRRPTVAAIGTADYPTRARRPANSRLDSTRFAAAFGVTARPWQQRTREVVAALMSTSTGARWSTASYLHADSIFTRPPGSLRQEALASFPREYTASTSQEATMITETRLGPPQTERPQGRIQPIILSGGSGTRLWPLSREAYPKQFLALAGERSLLQHTAARVADRDRFLPPIVVCNAEHRFIVAEQLRQVGIEPAASVLEPAARNTAPAVAVGAMMAVTGNRQQPILVLPSDHAIRRPDTFRAAIETGLAAAMRGKLVTFGVKPSGPETGYGYIQTGPALDEAPGTHSVARFVEKPDAARARQFLDQGDHYWNGGIFLMRADVYLDELKRYEPAILDSCTAAFHAATQDRDFIRLDAAAFERSPGKSVDYAVMERTRHAAVVPVDMGWSDVGSWEALLMEADRDVDGNVVIGDVIAEDMRGCYVRADSGLMVATLGVEDLVIVATGDAMLVTRRDRSQDVKRVVERLRAAGRSESTTHLKVFRPWGYYETIGAGDRHQVKHISVLPGRALSLQMHHKRAEHWVVVRGVARVTRGNDMFELYENQSTYIPLGMRHRLENPGEDPLHLIEVQSGSYLGEDDIVRFDDNYGRA